MRRFADFLLLGVTSGELVLLLLITPTFAIADWIYVSQHLVVLGIALTRPAPKAQDRRTARCPPAPPASCHMPIHTLSSRTCDGCPATEFRHGPPGDRGMGSLVYRIHAEERILARDIGWPNYLTVVRYRLLPGLW